MVKKLWGGTFTKQQKAELFSFLSSEDICLDSKLAVFDIEGSIAHVCMLAKQKILPSSQAAEILSALLKLHSDAQQGKFSVDSSAEDVHTAVEFAVTKITSAGKNMHIGRSRNDQVSLDMRMYMRHKILEACDALFALQDALKQLSKKDCTFPYYTHFQVAQPSSVHLWAHSYFFAFERDIGRLAELYRRVNVNPLGAGAGTGTEWNIDKNYTTCLLGFFEAASNPTDAISSRGELEAEFLGVLLISMVHCSRIAEDLIVLSNKGLVILPDEYCTGSSMMPQKKNPDPLELIRGKASRLLGLYVHCASLLKSLPTGYSKDSQESKYAIMAGVETAIQAFSILAKILPLVKFDEEKIIQELEEGYATATALADLLAKHGVPFRDAHATAGKLVRFCADSKRPLSSLSEDELLKFANVTIPQQELKEALSVDKTHKLKQAYKFPARSAFFRQIKIFKNSLTKSRKNLLSVAKKLASAG
ncbi:MAG: argininosuccinate lyase [Candidatus Micrarchaeota archaeon]|nr:argininosuccinate lyase [Candidatus Micrarchaeota archaeon]